CLYPPWARLLSAWALAKLHARGYAGPYHKALLGILERDRDPMLCLEAFKAAAAAPGPGTLKAMRKYLDRFPKPPPGAGFSPMGVYLAMTRSPGWKRVGNRAAPPAAGGAPSPLSADLDHLLAEIRGGGPETERDLRILAKMGKSLDDPRARVQVGKTLAVLLERGGLFPGTALVGAVAAFRDTWSLGGLLRLLARRGKARPETRRVWVRLVALYPDWAATRWLVDRLSDPDRRVRAEAARMLRKRPDAVGPLLSLAAGGRTLTLRLAALDALASSWGARNFSLRRAVSRLLADSSYQVREKALQLLLFWKCREALPQMLTLCAEDPSQRVRWAAARGLQILGDQGTAAKIRSLLSSPGVHSRELRFALAGMKAGK
ncbi:MAG TPA: HEAT repeat domain-containing protein, partial [Planctomycetes bacterium]|nr:HEAT repeat domain-containing protein [Planctomycetota bacterium]